MLVFVPENQVQNYLIILYVPLLLLLNNLLLLPENQVQIISLFYMCLLLV